MTAYFKLDGTHYRMFHQAVLDLFDYDELTLLLRTRLNKQLSHITGPGGMSAVVQSVVNAAERQMWLDDLVLAASEARPRHPGLEQLVEEVSLGAATTPEVRDGLQRYYQDIGGFLDWEVVGRLLKAVCQISYTTPHGQRHEGTGFLISPQVVMTNYHVMEWVIKNGVGYGDVRLKFDYKLKDDGLTLNPGTVYNLDQNQPLISSSPYSEHDLRYSQEPLPTDANELDYALLRLAEPVGAMPIDSKGGTEVVATTENQRGWVEIEAQPQLPALNAPLMIIQHPAGGALKVAFDPASITSHNPTNTRTRHRTATLDGSSGSPCFDARWKLVGLHNGTDPLLNRPAQYNQMVPIKAICAHLQSNNVLGTINNNN